MYSTDAIILSIYNFSEADELVSLYTKEFGKIRVKVKSSKKITTKQGNFLHNFAISRCFFISGRAGYILSGIMDIRVYFNISKNLLTQGYIEGLLNLCDNLFYEGQRDNEIWNLLEQALVDTEEIACLPDERIGHGYYDKNFALWRKEKIWLISLLKLLGLKSENFNFKNFSQPSQLDNYLQKILQNKFEQKVDFFGIKMNKNL